MEYAPRGSTEAAIVNRKHFLNLDDDGNKIIMNHSRVNDNTTNTDTAICISNAALASESKIIRRQKVCIINSLQRKSDTNHIT